MHSEDDESENYFGDSDPMGPIPNLEFNLKLLVQAYNELPRKEDGKGEKTGVEFVDQILDFVERNYGQNWEEWLNEEAPGKDYFEQFYYRSLAICWLSLQSFSFESKGDREGAWDFALRSTYHTGVLSGEVGAANAWAKDSDKSVVIKQLTKKANDARHQKNRERAALIEQFFLENHLRFSSLDAAAEAVTKRFPVSFRTARKHIGAANKLRPTRKE